MDLKNWLLCFGIALTLIACQSDPTSSDENSNHDQQTEDNKEKSTQEEAGQEESATAEKTLSFELQGEEYTEASAGEIYAKYIPNSSDAKKEDFEEAREKAISRYMEKIGEQDTKGWTAEQWATSLVTNLRGDHKTHLAPVKDYKIVYESLKLPDGRLLQNISEEELNKKASGVNVALLIDSSGSMKATVDGETKMNAAKETVQSFANNLPPKTKTALYVFGHKGSGSDEDQSRSCSSIESIYPLDSYDQNRFNESTTTFSAKGWTPLAATIQKATADLKENSQEDTKNFIYIVSDGKETCDGDPVKAAQEATSQGMNVEVHIIGFQVDNEATEQLKKVAEAGNGTFTSVENPKQLNDTVMKSWKESISKTTWRFWSAGNHNNLNWDSVGMSNDLRALYNNYQAVKDNEFWRLNSTLDQLLAQEYITFDQKGEIQDLLSKRRDAIDEYSSSIYDKKHDEIFSEADRLKKIIDEVTKDLDL